MDIGAWVLIGFGSLVIVVTLCRFLFRYETTDHLSNSVVFVAGLVIILGVLLTIPTDKYREGRCNKLKAKGLNAVFIDKKCYLDLGNDHFTADLPINSIVTRKEIEGK